MSSSVATRVVVSVDQVTVELGDGTRLLDVASLEIRRGELVAIVGSSGSGKTTLLETLAGLRRPTTGRIELGVRNGPLGYVPQDDIVHRDLTVESTVRHAARLRLPSGTTPETVDAAVDRALALLGLDDRRRLAVGMLSGGQRKRASIATELVVQPDVCMLDEPTAGLDPAAAASLMDVLRSLADRGTAIVMSTHNLADVSVADRLIVMGDGGRIVFDGSPSDGAAYLAPPRPPAVRDRAVISMSVPVEPRRSSLGDPPSRRPLLAQVAVLTARNAELVRRNRMSLAIMAGSPVLVVAMLAVLFPHDTFAVGDVDASVSIGLVYWLAFAGFFFGLTFGLLQICTELPIVRRERLVTIDLGPYLIAKALVLLPILGLANGIMIVTLCVLGRLPSLGLGDALEVWLVLGLDAVAGLALGLLASASVVSPAQAALALPMLCFPQVLFSGAVLPVASMAPIGRWIAAIMSDRWAFEALARTLDVGDVPAGASAPPAVELHRGALSGGIGAHSITMIALTLAFTVGARLVLARRTR